MFCCLASWWMFSFSFFCTQKICFQCFYHREYGTAGAEVDAKGGISWLLFSSHLWKAHSLSPDFSREICWIKSGSNTKGRREEEYFSYPHGTGMRVVQQTLINSPYLSPALSFWQVEKDGQYLGRLGSSRGYRSSRAARAGHSCPLCQQPPPPCSAEDRHFHSLSQIVPKGCASNTHCKHPSGLAQEDQHFPGWAPRRELRASLETTADCLSPRWKTICEGLCPWGFQEKSSLTHPGISPCYAEAKFQLGLFGGV